MATICKIRWRNSSGAARERWLVEWRDTAGKRSRRQFENLVEAKRFHAAVELGVAPAPKGSGGDVVRFTDAALEFIQSRVKLGREPSTWRAYDRHLRLHLGPLIGDADVRAMRRAQFLDLRERLLAKLSPALARAVFVTARAIMAYAVEREWRLDDPAKSVRFNNAGRDKPRIDIPPKADIRRLLEAFGAGDIATGAAPSRAFMLVRIALGTGMRASEIRGLRIVDLKLDRTPPQIEVTQRADQWRRIGPPKSRNGRRTIPIGPDLAALIARWIPLRRNLASPLVFPSTSGAPLDFSNFQHRHWRPTLMRLGLAADTGEGRWTFHRLRHIYASQLIEMGLNAKQVQMRLGHGSVTMTLDVYGHLWRDPEREAMEVTEFERRLLGMASKTPISQATGEAP
jgi:integrase